MESMQTLEERIEAWRRYVRKRPAVAQADIEELEDHLRTQVDFLTEAGLDEDEAFLVAVKRLGDLDSLSREFAREYSERLWKQLVVVARNGAPGLGGDRDALVAVGLGAAAAVAVKIPELFGLRLGAEADLSFYVRNLGLLVLPFLAAYFAWKRRLDRAACWWLSVPFVASAVAVNVLPYAPRGHTEILAAIHLPIALWLAAGFAYTGGRWRHGDERMNYVRFTGEWCLYMALIALGGGVLMGFTVFVFEVIGLDAGRVVAEWVLPCGAAGAILVAAWLVESKQSVIENMAPVLTRLFTPLFTVLLLLFLGTMLWTGNAIDVEREVLIGFDLLLVVVLGLLLYAISARDPAAPPGPFDALQLALVVAALLVDVGALWAITARISEFGFSPNKTAALGENLILLVNLGGSAVLYARFVMRRSPFVRLECWQTAYIPVYAVWAWCVVVLFPILFNYR